MNRSNQYCQCLRCKDLRRRDICPHCHHQLDSKGKNDKVENNVTNTNTFNPSITINVNHGHTQGNIGLETLQYIALAEDAKKIYTNEDALKQYGSSDILSPNSVANVNLFVNGVLQPPSIYDVKEGELSLKSSDLPPVNAPIILLFVIVKS